MYYDNKFSFVLAIRRHQLCKTCQCYSDGGIYFDIDVVPLYGVYPFVSSL